MKSNIKKLLYKIPKCYKTILRAYESLFVICKDNRLLIGGSNKFYILGNKENEYFDNFKDTNLKVKYVECTDLNTFVIDKDNNLWVSGVNHFGQLGLPIINFVKEFTKIENLKVKKIYSDSYSTFLITNDNDLYVSGFNQFYQLGLEHNDEVDSFIKVPNLKIKKIIIRGFNVTAIGLNNEIYETGLSLEKDDNGEYKLIKKWYLKNR